MSEQNDDTLHMVQLELAPRRLAELGKRLGLFEGINGRQQVDTNYLVHCALGELFQDQAPKPFCVQAAPQKLAPTNSQAERAVRILGYTSTPDEVLHELAKAFAPPAVYDGCDWDALATKEMPATFPEGMTLGFELRACPVVRKASAGEGENQAGETRTWKKGQELDAFLAEAWTRPDEEDLDRESVYHDWLKRQFDERGGATLDTFAMDRFAIERAVRRTHGNGRTAKTIKIPDVTFSGTLRVTDPDAFTALLKSGLGRHKSFGFGMLKVRRA